MSNRRNRRRARRLRFRFRVVPGRSQSRPAIPQNRPKCNALRGITGEQFLLDNGVLEHRHGRNANDYRQHRHPSSR